MARFFVGIVIVLAVVALFAFASDLFPDGSFVHELGEGIKNVAGDMFGGGYGAVAPG